MQIAVLGGNGFIGSNLVQELLARQHLVRVFDRPNVASPLPPEVCRNVERVAGDLADEASLQSALKGAETVFHLISTTLAQSSTDNPAYDVETNVVSTIRMLEVAKSLGVRKVIFLSSGGTVYGVPRRTPIDEEHPCDPITSYGITKLTIEKYLALYRRHAGLDYVVLRVANPFGRYQRPMATQGAVAVFIKRILDDQPIEIWGDGSVVRDFIHISDVTKALCATLTYDGENRIFNIGSGTGVSLNELVEAIGSVLGKKPDVRYLPARRIDVPSNVLDISLAKKSLHWEPSVGLVDGLKLTAEFLRGL
jgi:UDP-glucose 4-epimerase